MKGAAQRQRVAWIAPAVGVVLLTAAATPRFSGDRIDDAWSRALRDPPADTTAVFSRHLQRNTRPSRTLLEKFPLNPVLQIGERGEYDYGHVEYPSVVVAGDSLWMFYSAYGHGYWRIAAATSRDGVHWHKHGAVLEPDTTRGSWDGRAVATPSVLFDPAAPSHERFRLYYAGKTGPRYRNIGLAVSADGLHWVRRGRVLSIGGSEDWDRAQIADPSVLRVNGGYRMYYIGSRTRDGLFAVGLALSSDGEQWVKFPDSPVYAPHRSQGKGLYTVDVASVGGEFLLFEATEADDGFLEMFASRSRDGLVFDPLKRRLVLSASRDGSWDHQKVYGMDVLILDARAYVWFNGIFRGQRHGGQIGLARAPVATLIDALELPAAGGDVPEP